jgi:hypothetical protein
VRRALAILMVVTVVAFLAWGELHGRTSDGPAEAKTPRAAYTGQPCDAPNPTVHGQRCGWWRRPVTSRVTAEGATPTERDQSTRVTWWRVESGRLDRLPPGARPLTVQQRVMVAVPDDVDTPTGPASGLIAGLGRNAWWIIPTMILLWLVSRIPALRNGRPG